MPFKSEAQRRYFYYKASQPGAEGKKWKKHLRKYKESTPKGVKLPERVKTASQVAFDHGFYLEMAKIAEKDSKTDRVLKALPGIGAIAGAAAGALNPKGVAGQELKALLPKYIKKVGLNSPQGRAMAALLGAGTFATVGWIPATLKDTYDAAKSR